MSTESKFERVRFVSGSSTFTLSVVAATTPSSIEPAGSLSRSTDGKIWRSLGGGSWEEVGAGGAADIFDPPAAAHADDDEFTSTTLNSAWIQQAGTWTQGNIDPYAAFSSGDVRYELHTDRRRSWLMFQCPATGAGRLVKNVTVGTNEFFWMRGSFSSRSGVSTTNNDCSLGLTVSSSPFDANNHINLLLNESDAGVIQAEFSKAVGGVFTSHGTTANIGTSDLQRIEAVGLQKLGTTYHAWAFAGSGHAIYIGSTTFSTTLGTMGIIASNAATTAPGNMILGVDFIRRRSSAVWLP